MKFLPNEPPRRFRCGAENKIEIKDCGKINLDDDEQVTFVSGDSEYDLTRKSWGYYATPSLNGRLSSFGLRGCLIVNRNTGRRFVVLVQTGQEHQFFEYLDAEDLILVTWLDS